MNRELKKLKLYRDLIPSKVGEKIGLIIASIALFFLLGFGIFGCYAMISEDISGAVVSSVILAMIVAFFSFVVIKGYKKKITLNKARRNILAELDYADIAALEEQIGKSEFLYKTFYLLDRHLYVPKAKLIIKYSDIANYKNIIHRTNGINDGVRFCITDKNKVAFEFWVKDWKDFYGGMLWFSDTLNEKINTSVNR